MLHLMSSGLKVARVVVEWLLVGVLSVLPVPLLQVPIDVLFSPPQTLSKMSQRSSTNDTLQNYSYYKFRAVKGRQPFA